jgi:hypothetical protein
VTTCARKIFAERFTPFIESWARVTQCLYQIVQVIGQADFWQARESVSETRLGRETTRQTILRCIMALPIEPVEQIPQIGIDDLRV